MSIVFRTEDAPPAARVDYWRHVVDRTGLLVEGRACLPAQGAEPLDAWLRIGDAGAVRVIQATTPPGECRRTRQLIRRADTERYEVCVLTRGHLTIRQGHQESRLGPGDLTLIDQTRPQRLPHPAMHHVSVLFPRGCWRSARTRPRSSPGSGSRATAEPARWSRRSRGSSPTIWTVPGRRSVPGWAPPCWTCSRWR